MFKVLVDTSTKDLVIALIKNDKCIDYIYVKNLLKKTDVLPIYFKELLNKNKLKTKDIKSFYCTNGPGSFTGSRSGFIFFKTICLITHATLYLSSSMQFLAKANQDVEVIVDARSKMQYVAQFKNKKIIGEIKLLISDSPITEFDFADFKNNVAIYLKDFIKVENLLDTKVNYIKHPSIGEVKK